MVSATSVLNVFALYCLSCSTLALEHGFMRELDVSPIFSFFALFSSTEYVSSAAPLDALYPASVRGFDISAANRRRHYRNKKGYLHRRMNRVVAAG